MIRKAVIVSSIIAVGILVLWLTVGTVGAQAVPDPVPPQKQLDAIPTIGNLYAMWQSDELYIGTLKQVIRDQAEEIRKLKEQMKKESE